MNEKKRFSPWLKIVVAAGFVGACTLGFAAWLMLNPTQQRSAVILISPDKSGRNGRPRTLVSEVSDYVQKVRDSSQFSKILSADARLSQLKIPAMNSNPESWLQGHLNVRSISNPRMAARTTLIEITARARNEADSADLDSLIGLAAEVLIVDAFHSGLVAHAVSVDGS